MRIFKVDVCISVGIFSLNICIKH